MNGMARSYILYDIIVVGPRRKTTEQGKNTLRPYLMRDRKQRRSKAENGIYFFIWIFPSEEKSYVLGARASDHFFNTLVLVSGG